MTTHRSETTTSGAHPSQVPLDPTGISGLDEVLGGGIQRGSLAILAGPPGSGKTILAHHIAFRAARNGRQTTVLTAFSEPTNKLIAHMRPFAFFDQDLLGQTLEVLSIQHYLRQGLDAAAEEIFGAVRASKSTFVVLDGFRGVRETAEHPDEARRFIYEVSNRLSLLGVTLLLTSEANVRDTTFFPEATTADVLMGLAFDAVDARERRTLEILKARGAAPLTGKHTLVISEEGITVYPRLEARVAHLVGLSRPPSAPDENHARQPGADGPLATGIPGLDSLLNGGLVRGASTLVVGERGAGKTLLGLQFAAQGASVGEPGVLVSFRETEDDLIRKVAPFHWGAAFRQALEDGALTLQRTAPVELRADALADRLLSLLDQTRAQRLVLDEVGELERALVAVGYAHRFHDFLAALIEALRLRNVTAVLTKQLAAKRHAALERRLGPPGALTQNLLWLRQEPEEPGGQGPSRSLTILQTALSSRSGAWRAISIGAPEGIAVLDAADDQTSVAQRRKGAPR